MCRSGDNEDITTMQEKLGDLAVLVNDMNELRGEEKGKKGKKVDEEKVAADDIRNAALVTVKRKSNGEQQF